MPYYAIHCNALHLGPIHWENHHETLCSVMQCVAACCSVLQYGACLFMRQILVCVCACVCICMCMCVCVCMCNTLQHTATHCSTLQRGTYLSGRSLPLCVCVCVRVRARACPGPAHVGEHVTADCIKLNVHTDPYMVICAHTSVMGHRFVIGCDTHL